jgi:hypothetical protein
MQLVRDRGAVILVGAAGLDLEREPLFRKEVAFRVSRSYGPGRYDPAYEEKGQDDGHTFLFVVSSRVVIDAGVDGNDARFINHSCDPNCETVIEGGRVFIEAVRDIRKGEELGYEYGLTWESTDDPDELANYACRCGAARCRGSMLDPVPLDKKRKAKRRAAKKKAAPARKKARK